MSIIEVSTFSELLDGITTAAANDTIKLRNGEYVITQDIDLQDKPLTIISEYNDHSGVIFNFDDGNKRIILNDPAHDVTRISAITIKNATTVGLPAKAGIIDISGCSPILEDFLWQDCIVGATQTGLIAINEQAYPTITRPVFYSNNLGLASNIGLIFAYSSVDTGSNRFSIDDPIFGAASLGNTITGDLVSLVEIALINSYIYAQFNLIGGDFSYNQIIDGNTSYLVHTNGGRGCTVRNTRFHHGIFDGSNQVSASIGVRAQSGNVLISGVVVDNNIIGGASNLDGGSAMTISTSNFIEIVGSDIHDNHTTGLVTDHCTGGLLVYRMHGAAHLCHIKDSSVRDNALVNAKGAANIYVHAGGVYSGADNITTALTEHTEITGGTVEGSTGLNSGGLCASGFSDGVSIAKAIIANSLVSGNDSAGAYGNDLVADKNGGAEASIIGDSVVLNSALPNWSENNGGTITLTNSLSKLFKSGTGNLTNTNIASPVAASALPALSVGDYGATRHQSRSVIPPSTYGLTGIGHKIRVRLAGHTTQQTKIVHASIGVRQSGSTMAATPTALTFGGSPGVNIPVGESIWSDWVDFFYNGTTDHLIHVTAEDTTRIYMQLRSTSPAVTGYRAYDSSVTADQWDQASVTGFSSSATVLYHVIGIEIASSQEPNLATNLAENQLNGRVKYSLLDPPQWPSAPEIIARVGVDNAMYGSDGVGVVFDTPADALAAVATLADDTYLFAGTKAAAMYSVDMSAQAAKIKKIVGD